MSQACALSRKWAVSRDSYAIDGKPHNTANLNRPFRTNYKQDCATIDDKPGDGRSSASETSLLHNSKDKGL